MRTTSIVLCLMRVAYVIDYSASMTDTMSTVRPLVKRLIGDLKPSQAFYIAIFSTGPAAEVSDGKMMPASETNKKRAYALIDAIKPNGDTDPSAALKRAFASGPDTVYVSDGEFDPPGHEGFRVANLIDQFNVDHRAVVNTLCPYMPGEVLMKEIARRNHGTFKALYDDDVEKLINGDTK